MPVRLSQFQALRYPPAERSADSAHDARLDCSWSAHRVTTACIAAFPIAHDTVRREPNRRYRHGLWSTAPAGHIDYREPPQAGDFRAPESPPKKPAVAERAAFESYPESGPSLLPRSLPPVECGVPACLRVRSPY